MISLPLSIAGDVASFGSAERSTLKASLRSSLGCIEPACFLSLVVSAGSVTVEARLTVPEAASAQQGGAASSAPGGTAARAIEAAAIALVAQSPSSMSARLGVTVEAAASVSVATGQRVPMLVAPPPPSPPRSPPPMAPATVLVSPPFPPLFPGNASATTSEGSLSPAMTPTVLATALGGVTAVCLVAALARRHLLIIPRRRRTQVKASPAAPE